MNEAETCWDFVIPGLLAAGWKDEQIREQVTFTDSRIVPLAGQRAMRVGRSSKVYPKYCL
jgi:type I site-specific restriction endonuclease